LNQHYSKNALKNAINRMWYQGSNTRTGDALMGLKRDIFTTNNGMRDDKSIPKVSRFSILYLRQRHAYWLCESSDFSRFFPDLLTIFPDFCKLDNLTCPCKALLTL